MMDYQEREEPAAGATIRRAGTEDFAGIYDVWYDNEVGDDPNPPPRTMLPDYAHILATGELYVAEQDGQIAGFAGTVTRGTVTFLTDLFVRPRRHSAGLGGRLLRRAFAAHAERIRCTVSSNDLRAQSLYIRAGMRPQWPEYLLRADAPPGAAPFGGDLAIVEGQAGDPALVQWDADIGGRERPQDHAYWVEQEGGVPLWFRREGRTLGYGYARLRAGTLWSPGAARIGPVGAHTPENAAACVCAAMRWAAGRARVLRIDIPGPHPALAALLAMGFQITYVETFVSTARTPFFDPTRYAGSGGSLL